MRPAGAGNFLKWRRGIIEHLELRRLTFYEYAMFNWLCTKAHPYSGTVRTSWPTLATETGLSAAHTEKLCRSLRDKGYVWYPLHAGARRRVVEVAIDKFPLATGGYTDLRHRRGEAAADFPAEVAARTSAESRTCPPARSEIREREQEQERDLSSFSRSDPVAVRELLATLPWWRPSPEA